MITGYQNFVHIVQADNDEKIFKKIWQERESSQLRNANLSFITTKQGWCGNGPIRECQPKTFEQWKKWYFENANTDGKTPNKITKESLEELGERLFVKIKEIVIPE